MSTLSILLRKLFIEPARGRQASPEPVPAGEPCTECGSELVTSRRWIKMDPRGYVLETAARAHSCPDCGRYFVPRAMLELMREAGQLAPCSRKNVHRMVPRETLSEKRDSLAPA